MWRETGLWADVRELPDSVAATLDAADGFDETAALLSGAGRAPDRRERERRRLLRRARAVAGGLAGRDGGPEVVAVPSGLLAGGWFRFRPGDRLLAISSSGEFRDLVEAVEAGLRPAAVRRGDGDRRLDDRARRRRPGAPACARTSAPSRTPRPWPAGWRRRSPSGRGSRTTPALARAIAGLPERPGAGRRDGRGVGRGPRRGSGAGGRDRVLGRPRVGGRARGGAPAQGGGRRPAEGVDAREGATSAMYALGASHLAAQPPVGDPSEPEAERACAETGARVVRCPGGGEADPRLALATTLPAACALAATLADAAGLDIDRPAWVDAYYRTARRAPTSGDG